MPLVRSVEVARFTPITSGARVFALLALAPPVAFTQSYPVILCTMLLAAVWTAATFAGGVPGLPLMPAIVVESSLVALLVTLPMNYTTLLVPALVIPQFVAGINLGIRGAFEALGAQIVVLTATISSNSQLNASPALLALLFTWLLAGLGFGLIGAVIRSARLELGDTTRSSYRDARALLTQLLELSDDLVEGLDPISIGQHIVSVAREEIPLSGVLVHARTPDGTITLLDGESGVEPVSGWGDLVDEAFATGRSQHRGTAVAIPVQTDASVVAVLSARLAPGVDPEHIGLDEVLAAVAKSLRPAALQLDTALVFSAVRESATAEERQRLAREMHDGVAQDLASFGYLIDDAAAEAGSEAQRDRLMELRGELTMVVAELRRSVFSLRNEAVVERTLGERIAIMAEHLEARFGVRVEVVVNEGEGRLRPEVENELQRIAQEGMNNAVKHAHASVIHVRCVVQTPHGLIRVLDDGVGLQDGRPDSHGVKIMRERARRIGADFRLSDTGSGTLLEVTLGTPATHRSDTPTPLEGSTRS
ncbi:MAG: histidine kinase [Nocardioides sp.]